MQKTVFIFILVVFCGCLLYGKSIEKDVVMEIYANQARDTINANIYGHFSEHLGRCVYEGYWVGQDSEIANTRGIRNDVVDALKRLNIPVLRWPGGCFADEYHWKEGVGPYAGRTAMINTHWGGVIENNHFGTHEFLDLCQQLGCEPYISGNVGSGTVKEMQDWVEYITFDGNSPMADWRRQNGREQPWKVKFWGVGNENWGCGGNMRPQYYADLYKRFQTYLRNLSGNRLYKIACGAHDDHYNWTEVLMREAGQRMQGLSFHYYTITGNWRNKGSATRFDEKAYFTTLKKAIRMDELLKKHATIMDRYDPEKRVGLVVDEWGAWHDVEPETNPGFLYQQNTLRDAMVAALTLHIFHKHCDRVQMANIAQTINVLQSMILTRGPEMILTPTYWVFEMFKPHQNAMRLPLAFESPLYRVQDEEMAAVSASASRHVKGTVFLSLCNIDPHKSHRLHIQVYGYESAAVRGRILTSEKLNGHNTFEQPHQVEPAVFEQAGIKEGKVIVDLPATSIVVLELE